MTISKSIRNKSQAVVRTAQYCLYVTGKIPCRRFLPLRGIMLKTNKSLVPKWMGATSRCSNSGASFKVSENVLKPLISIVYLDRA